MHLGIRHIGLRKCKINLNILNHFQIFKIIIQKKIMNDLLNIDGIGETQVNSIKSFFANKTNIEVLNELEKVLELIKNAIQKKMDH